MALTAPCLTTALLLLAAAAGGPTAHGLLINVPSWASYSRRARQPMVRIENPVQVSMWASQSGEDNYTYTTFFDRMVAGTYLEIGGLDGIFFSNTLSLNKYMGWRGVLVEASPESYAKLARNRPDDFCINAAVCKEPATVHYLVHGGGHPAVNGIYEFMPEGFRKQWFPNVTLESVNALPPITCQPLMSLLAKTGITTFDFFSLDVEGAELLVLQSIDFKVLHFSVIVVETQYSSTDTAAAINEILTSNGYINHGPDPGDKERRNTWYVHRRYQAEMKMRGHALRS